MAARFAIAPRAGAALLAALLAAAAPPLAAPAGAAGAIGMGWDECRSGSGSADQGFTCGDNDLALELVVSFEVPAVTSAVIGVDVVVDVQHGAATLPDWWRMEGGGCRSGGLVASADFAPQFECADPWGGLAGAALNGFDVGQPRGGAAQARIRASAGVLPKNAVTLLPGTAYYALKLRFLTAKTTGPGACEGCVGAACLVLNGVTVRTLGGAGDLTLTTPAFAGGNHAGWRGGTDCAPVPALRPTWGRVKALYRS